MHWMPFLLHQKTREINENLFVLSWEKLLSVTPDIRFSKNEHSSQGDTTPVHFTCFRPIHCPSLWNNQWTKKITFWCHKVCVSVQCRCLNQWQKLWKVAISCHSQLSNWFSILLTRNQSFSISIGPPCGQNILHMLSSGCLFCTVIAHCLNKTHSICNCTCEIMQHFILITRI